MLARSIAIGLILLVALIIAALGTLIKSEKKKIKDKLSFKR